MTLGTLFGLGELAFALIASCGAVLWLVARRHRPAPRQIRGATDDPTAVRLEERLAESLESEASTRTSLDHMLDGFAILRSVRDAGAIVDFEWTYINPAGAATYSRSPEDLIGENMSTSQPGLESSGVLDELRQVVITGDVLSSLRREYIDEAIGGFFDFRAWKLGDGLAITWRDVTDRETALAAVRLNEERFRTTIENLDEALSVLTAIRDETGFIVDFRWEFRNAAAIDLTGIADRDLAGRTLMAVLPEHHSNGMLAAYRNIVETGETYIERALWMERVWGHGRHARRAFDIRGTKLDDGIVVISRDVTQQRDQEDELARQRLELERSNKEMRLINSLADMLQSCATIDDAYVVATHSCAALLSEYSGSISVMQTSRDVLDRKAAWGQPVGEDRFASADCWALRRGRPHVSGATGARCPHLSGSPAGRCLCVPMMVSSRPLGAVHVMSTAGDDEDLEGGPTNRLTVIVAGQLSMAFANLRLRDSLREMSIRDPLTGLFNRRYMEETLNRELDLAARNSTHIAVLVLDIDQFKSFNDTYGHDAGDAILQAVSEVLTRYSRGSDVACRFGGEEFLVILPNCSLDDAQLRADEIRRRISALRIPYRGINLSGPTISCGLAAFPEHGDDAEGLIHIADRALYSAKDAGRDQVAVAPLDSTAVRFDP
jgi:diguanylate cyclase (GGDEF)-like protein/PAS domain S-box-containing protein